MTSLKPQDVVVALKLVSLGDATWTYPFLGKELGISSSAAHASVRRAATSGLVNPHTRRPVVGALTEFLLHGVRYAFPAVRGRTARGVATAASAPILRDRLGSGAVLVWPTRTGDLRGESLTPLHASGPRGAERDRRLYDLLALVDALRVGTAREREVAASMLREALRGD